MIDISVCRATDCILHVDHGNNFHHLLPPSSISYNNARGTYIGFRSGAPGYLYQLFYMCKYHARSPDILLIFLADATEVS